MSPSYINSKNNLSEPTGSDLSDAELIAGYSQGKERYLKVLIERYMKTVYNFIVYYIGNIEDAEDIMQDVFLRAWKNLKKFDHTKPFKIWIFTIAKNASLDWIKKKKPVLFSQFENEEGENALLDTLPDESVVSSDVFFEKKENAEMLGEVMKKLSPQYQTVLFMYYHEELTLQEIGDVLNKPVDTIKSQHRRALKSLRKHLKDAPKKAFKSY
jgi:RNA polymerase sigma-70 factor (ECF subfamily)